MKKELLPIIDSKKIKKISFDNINISKEILFLSNVISDNIFFNESIIDDIETLSKYIYMKKKELNISKEVENLIALSTLNNLLGAVVSLNEEKESTKYHLENEYYKMSNSFKNIVKKLYEEKREMSQKDLAKSLGWSSANVTKQFKETNSFRFVKIYKLNDRNVFYSLSDDALSFMDKIESSKYEEKIDFHHKFKNVIKLNDNVLDYESVKYKGRG